MNSVLVTAAGGGLLNPEVENISIPITEGYWGMMYPNNFVTD